MTVAEELASVTSWLGHEATVVVDQRGVRLVLKAATPYAIDLSRIIEEIVEAKLAAIKAAEAETDGN